MAFRQVRSFLLLALLVVTTANPLEGHTFHIERSYRRNVQRSIESAPASDKPFLERIKDVPTAYWLDVKSKVQNTSSQNLQNSSSSMRTAAKILRAAARHDPAHLVTFVVYDLPNRDCAAHASRGEICCSYEQDGTCNFEDTSNACEDGIEEYKTEYIDKLGNTIAEYCSRVPMALIIEPDSLPNLVTNMDKPSCANEATQNSYREGVKYAVETLSIACPQAIIYVDAAHGGWLGWKDNSEGFAQEISQLNIVDKIRGFALNVANYQEMGAMCPAIGTCMPESQNKNDACCQDDRCSLSAEWNPGFTLLNYAEVLKEKMEAAIPGFEVHYVLDTGRNGVPDPRVECANWCNIRGAGLGHLPTTNTAMSGVIDAYMWIKTPGESDGCTETLPDGSPCPRFDLACSSQDSIGSNNGTIQESADEPMAPEAGNWFDYQIRMLARNARLGTT